jgi:hypothetical protein
LKTCEAAAGDAHKALVIAWCKFQLSAMPAPTLSRTKTYWRGRNSGTAGKRTLITIRRPARLDRHTCGGPDPVQAARGLRKLLELLARDPDVQAGFGLEWPVRKIVDALNISDPDPRWNDDRIENAKKRLRNWNGA